MNAPLNKHILLWWFEDQKRLSHKQLNVLSSNYPSAIGWANKLKRKINIERIVA